MLTQWRAPRPWCPACPLRRRKPEVCPESTGCHTPELPPSGPPGHTRLSRSEPGKWTTYHQPRSPPPLQPAPEILRYLPLNKKQKQKPPLALCALCPPPKRLPPPEASTVLPPSTSHPLHPSLHFQSERKASPSAVMEAADHSSAQRLPVTCRRKCPLLNQHSRPRTAPATPAGQRG